MITSRQTFKNPDRSDLEVSHNPAVMTGTYRISLAQAGCIVVLDLYELKKISRVANKNIKELEDDPALRERMEKVENTGT